MSKFLALSICAFLSYSLTMLGVGLWYGQKRAVEEIDRQTKTQTTESRDHDMYDADSGPSDYARVLMTKDAIVFAIPSGFAYLKPLKIMANGDIYSFGRKIESDREIAVNLRKWLSVAASESAYMAKDKVREIIVAEKKAITDAAANDPN